MGIPATTIYDRLRIHQNKGIIKKNVCLVDFSKIGLGSHIYLSLKAERESRKGLENFLRGHSNVNSLYKTNFGNNYLVEGVFRSPNEVEEFIEKSDLINEILKSSRYVIL
jgi:DNA-binding Lrp family transcriptional regulator